MQAIGAYQSKLRQLERGRRNRDGLTRLIDLAQSGLKERRSAIRDGDTTKTALGGERFNFASAEWWKKTERPPPIETQTPTNGNGKPKPAAGIERLAKALADGTTSFQDQDPAQRDNDGGILPFGLFTFLNGSGAQEPQSASNHDNTTKAATPAIANGKINGDFTKRRDRAVPCRLELLALNLQAMVQAMAVGDGVEAHQLVEDCLKDVRSLRSWELSARQIHQGVMAELAAPAPLVQLELI